MMDRFGMSLHDIATTDPKDYPELLERVIGALIAADTPPSDR